MTWPEQLGTGWPLASDVLSECQTSRLRCCSRLLCFDRLPPAPTHGKAVTILAFPSIVHTSSHLRGILRRTVQVSASVQHTTTHVLLWLPTSLLESSSASRSSRHTDPVESTLGELGF